MTYDPEKHHRRSIRLPQYDYTQSGVYFVTICTHERECVLGDVVDGVMILNDWGIIADRFWDEVSAHFRGVAIDAHVIMPNHVHADIVIVQNPIRRGEVSSPALATTRAAIQGEGTSPALATTRAAIQGEGTSPALATTRAAIQGEVSSPALATTRAAIQGGGTPPALATTRAAIQGGGTPPALATTRAAIQGGGTPPLQPALGQIVAYYKYQTTKAINLMRDMPGAKFWQRNYWEHVIRNDAEMSRILEYIETNPARWSNDQLYPAAQPNRFNQE